MMKTPSSTFVVAVMMTLLSSYSVDSFVVNPTTTTTTTSTTAMYQSSIPADYTATSSSSYHHQQQQQQHERIDIQIIKKQQKNNYNNKSSTKRKNVYDPSTSSSPSTTATTAAAAATTEQEQELLQGLHEMSLKDLKLQCSRRSITYYKFTSQQQFIDAVWENMQEALSFSVTGLIKPGMVGDITGQQLDQEMTTSGMILVDVNAKWYVVCTYDIYYCCCFCSHPLSWLLFLIQTCVVYFIILFLQVWTVSNVITTIRGCITNFK